ncbi:hypothetical protein SAMN05421768_104459 [Chryseobacterium joostei]|uniref:Uncharacterized protein n=1 Tax=Chryseobacterium joostei TaxID=112234 RepID=A0A1N7IF41_9FLAO|nr:hypothetical protein SAMN05421768_104459 [Chryseobacterium joostei]
MGFKVVIKVSKKKLIFYYKFNKINLLIFYLYNNVKILEYIYQTYD